MSINFGSKKVILLVAILVVGVLSAFFVASSIAQATAQHQQKVMWSGEAMPQINGSVSIANEASSFINENVKVLFPAAAETAQAQITEGSVLGGHLSIIQGYLVYTFLVANNGSETGHFVVVDAGNGNILHISKGQSLDSFGHPMFGSWKTHGFGGWHGPGKTYGFGWRMWH